MPRAKLDRTRQFSSYHGPGLTFKYEQDGVRFGADGNEYIDPAAPQSEPAKPFPLNTDERIANIVSGGKEPEFAKVFRAGEPGPEDGLDELKMKALRAVYFDLTEKAVAVGTNAEQLREMIRAIRRATAQGLDFKNPAAP